MPLNPDHETAARILDKNRRREFAELEQRRDEPLSLSRALTACVRGSFAQDCPKEFAAWGDPANAQKLRLPWSALGQRDLTAGGAGSGAELVASVDVPAAILPLVPESIVLRGGATVKMGMQNSVAVPVVETAPSFTWQSSESAQIPYDTSLVLGSRPAVPHLGGICVKASHQLVKQSNIDEDLRRLFLQLAGAALDAAALAGTGANGQPGGLLGGLSGNISTLGALSANQTTLALLEKTLSDDNVNDSRMLFSMAPGVRQLFRTRESFSGAGAIMKDMSIMGRTALTSTHIPSGLILGGDFSNIQVLLWGDGPQILVDPFSDFKTGAITFGLFIACDVVVNHPAAFCFAQVD